LKEAPGNWDEKREEDEGGELSCPTGVKLSDSRQDSCSLSRYQRTSRAAIKSLRSRPGHKGKALKKKPRKSQLFQEIEGLRDIIRDHTQMRSDLRPRTTEKRPLSAGRKTDCGRRRAKEGKRKANSSNRQNQERNIQRLVQEEFLSRLYREVGGGVGGVGGGVVLGSGWASKAD